MALALGLSGPMPAFGFELPAFELTSSVGTRSLLIGSMHAGFVLEGEIDSPLIARLTSFNSVYFESRPISVADLAELHKAMVSASLKAGDVGPSLAEALQAVVKSRPVLDQWLDSGAWAEVPPPIVAANLLSACGLTRAARSLDQELVSKLNPGVVVRDLEAPRQFFELSDSLPRDRWLIHLQAIATFVERGSCEHEITRYLDRVSRLLTTGQYADLRAEHEYFFREVVGSDFAVRELEFSVVREVRLADTIAEIAQFGSAAFIVGAAHLDGPGGLVSRLRSAGFSVNNLTP